MLIPSWSREWKAAQGFWAELPTALAYVGSTIIANEDFSGWVAHCTGWVIIVDLYLVWDAYDTGRLWWIPTTVRGALRSFPESSLLVYLGTDGLVNRKHFLYIIDAARWDVVSIRQSE